MKKLIFLLMMIVVSSYSLVAQNDIKTFTNIYIEGYGNLKIETVLDILNTNKDKLTKNSQEIEIDITGAIITKGYNISLVPYLDILIKNFKENSYLKMDEYKMLESYIKIAQENNIFISKSANPNELYFKELNANLSKISNGTTILATTSIIAITGTIVFTILYLSK